VSRPEELKSLQSARSLKSAEHDQGVSSGQVPIKQPLPIPEKKVIRSEQE